MKLNRFFTNQKNYTICAAICAGLPLLICTIFLAAFQSSFPSTVTEPSEMQLFLWIYIAMMVVATLHVAYTVLSLTVYKNDPKPKSSRNGLIFAGIVFLLAVVLAVDVYGHDAAQGVSGFSGMALLTVLLLLPTLLSLLLFVSCSYTFNAGAGVGFSKRGSFFAIASFCTIVVAALTLIISVFLPFVTAYAPAQGKVDEKSIVVYGYELLGMIFTSSHAIVEEIGGAPFFVFVGLCQVATLAVAVICIVLALKNLGGADEYSLKTYRSLGIFMLVISAVTFFCFTAVWNGFVGHWTPEGASGYVIDVFSVSYITLAVSLASVVLSAVWCARYRDVNVRLPYLTPVVEKAPATSEGDGEEAEAILDAPSMKFAALCFLVPPVGLALWLVWRKKSPLKARSCGVGAIYGITVYAALCVFILSLLVGVVGAL